MNWLIKIKQSQSYKEVQANVRLQWLMVGIVVILVISLSKSIYDTLSEKRQSLLKQANMLARLEATAQNPINEDLINQVNVHYNAQLSTFPRASSTSTAEAKALADVESKVGRLLTRKRVNLLGSEQIQVGQQIFWSVRIDIAGQLAAQDFVVFLANFDQGANTQRIASVQYSPKVSHSLSAVVDFIYKREANE